MRTSRRGSLALTLVLSAAVSAAAATDALAGDVTVARKGKKVLVTGTDADDSVQIRPGTTAGTLRVIGADGSTVNGAAEAEIAAGPKDSVEFDLGDGRNYVRFDDVDAAFKAIKYTGGAGVDALEFHSSRIDAPVTCRGGDGENWFGFGETTIGGPVTFDGGAGADYVVMETATIAGAVKVNLGRTDPEFTGNICQIRRSTTESSLTVTGGTG